MSDPSPRPFDPAEFTAEELQAAVTVSVTPCRGVEWRKTPSGGEARLHDGTLTKTVRANECHFAYECGPPLTDWLPCPDRRDAAALFEPPAPDHVAEEPPPGSP